MGQQSLTTAEEHIIAAWSQCPPTFKWWCTSNRPTGWESLYSAEQPQCRCQLPWWWGCCCYQLFYCMCCFVHAWSLNVHQHSNDGAHQIGWRAERAYSQQSSHNAAASCHGDEGVAVIGFIACVVLFIEHFGFEERRGMTLSAQNEFWDEKSFQFLFV